MARPALTVLLLSLLRLPAAAALADPRFPSVQLWGCGNASAGGTQQWLLNSTSLRDSSGASIFRIYSPSFERYWDLNGPSNASGTLIHLVWELNSSSQLWTMSGGQVRSVYAPGQCASAAAGVPGFPLVIEPCGSGPYAASQNFSYNAAAQTLSLAGDASVCVDAGSAANCSLPPYSGYVYCDASASPDDRAADLAGRLDGASIASLLGNENFGLPAFGISRINYGEALHGMLLGCLPASVARAPGSTGCPTSFPHALLLGGTFNRSLWGAVASAISDEGRAYYNAVNGSSHLITWAPDINPFRDPRWGRGQEVAGEDPFLIAQYIAQYARGMQAGEDARVTKLVSTAKHFSFYDFENSTALGENRLSFVANVTRQDAVRFYWPPFVAAVTEGSVQSIMCSYNSIAWADAPGGGPPLPSCTDGDMNNEMLRDAWGFGGFIVSDCDAVEFAYTEHHAFPNATATVAAALRGGCDVDCGSFYADNLGGALAEGLIALPDLQQAARRSLRAGFALGLWDPPGSNAYQSYGVERIDSPAHRALALDAAIQGMVLLKNDVVDGSTAPLLPLRAGAIKRLAVVGPNALSKQALLSNYAGYNELVNNHSVLQALTARGAAEGFAVDYAPGCTNATGLPNLWCQEDTGFAAAVAAAQAADVTVAVVGLCSICEYDGWRIEGEGCDRTNITLPGLQEALLQALAATGKPIVVVLIHGGPLAIEWTAANMPAILDAHYPGEMGGDAVTAVLFGDASPSGRLTTTVYPAAFVSQRNSTDMLLPAHLGPDGETPVPGVTHQFYAGPVLFPFGFGLSFTTFSFQWLNDSARTLDLGEVGRGASFVLGAPYAVNVTNTGLTTSDVSVLAFAAPGAPGDPIQVLFDFGRIAALAPGSSAVVYFTLPPPALASVDVHGQRWLLPGSKRVWIGEPGNFLETTLLLVGDALRLPDF